MIAHVKIVVRVKDRYIQAINNRVRLSVRQGNRVSGHVTGVEVSVWANAHAQVTSIVFNHQLIFRKDAEEFNNNKVTSR